MYRTCLTSFRIVFMIKSKAPPHESMPWTLYNCKASVAAPKAGFTSSKAFSKSDIVTCAHMCSLLLCDLYTGGLGLSAALDRRSNGRFNTHPLCMVV